MHQTDGLEGNTLARQEAKNQTAVEQGHDAGCYQVAPAPVEPGAGQEVCPQSEHPAAGADVYAGKAEQPDQRAAQQNNDRADRNEPIESFDDDQGTQNQKGNQVRAQVRKGSVQERRGDDAEQTVHGSRDQTEGHEAVAGRDVEQLQRDHEERQACDCLETFRASILDLDS